MSVAPQKAEMAAKPILEARSFLRNSLRRSAVAVSSTRNLGGQRRGAVSAGGMGE